MEALAGYGSSSSTNSDSEQEVNDDVRTGAGTSLEKQLGGARSIPVKTRSVFTPTRPVPQRATPLQDERYQPSPSIRGYVSKRKRGTCAEESRQTAPSTGAAVPASTSGPGLSLYLHSTAGTSKTLKQVKVASKCPKLCEQLPREHCKPVLSLDWHINNSNVLLSCSLDGTFKVWDIPHKKCIASCLMHHGAAVRCGQWMSHNTLVTGGFDSIALLSDVEKGQVITSFRHKEYVSVVKVHPVDRNLIFTGDFGANIQSWDLRSGKTTHQYVGASGKILDMVFLQSGRELVASSDIVRKNSSSQALRVWDVDSAVVVSNQVYSEPYTCPCLRAHPYRHEFYAQSNGNYIVVFSDRRPYKCSKYKRYEGHRVEGNSVQFDVSPDGSLLCSASANGQVLVYDHQTSTALQTLHVSDSPCVAVGWNQLTTSTIAVSDWNANVYILK